MEMAEDEEKGPPAYTVALFYALISFICVILLVLLVFVACSRKYRLNWFEKNLLETADAKELDHSQEALVQEMLPGSSKSLCTNSGEETFWVPPSSAQRSSLYPSDDEVNTSQEESVPESPTSSNSYQPFSGPIPIARSEKHVVLTNSSPVRPKVASMQAKLDHTKIDSSLYQKESPGGGEPEEFSGSLHITLNYDPIAEILTVRLVEAQDLQARDFSGTADPYAKIRLLPDKTNVWQTRIHKKTLNPVFDEDFVFEVRAATLGRHTLEILLYDFDAYSRHHRIGRVQIDLAHIDLSDRVDMWKGLNPCFGHDARLDLGELMVSLAYLPSAERLTVVVIKARNLRVVDDTRNSSAKRLPQFCRRSHPEYEECTIKALKKWGPYLLKGVPEINFPKLYPLHIPLFSVNRTISPTVSVFTTVKNMKVWGFEGVEMKSFNFDKKSLVGDIALHMPFLRVAFDFDIRGTILSLILDNTGHFQGNFTNLDFFFKFALSPVERIGVKYYQFGDFKANATVGDGHIGLSSSDPDMQVPLEGIENFYNSNPKASMDAIQPIYDESVGIFYGGLAEQVLKAIPGAELLPE